MPKQISDSLIALPLTLGGVYPPGLPFARQSARAYMFSGTDSMSTPDAATVDLQAFVTVNVGSVNPCLLGCVTGMNRAASMWHRRDRQLYGSRTGLVRG